MAGVCELPPGMDRQVTGVSAESRAVEPGFLFLALRGQRHHGLEFADEAARRGAGAILFDTPAPPIPPVGAALPCLPVPGLRDAVGTIADRFYGAPSEALRVIGVTGTDGKTSCSHFLAQALDEPGRRAGLIGTLGAGLLDGVQPLTHTTPDAVSVHRLLAELRAKGAESVAMEVSSHALDQGRVDGVKFRAALLTNVTRDHLDYHGSEAAYRAAKGRLFRCAGLTTAVLNAADPLGAELLRTGVAARQVIAYGLAPDVAGDHAHVYASQLHLGPAGMTLLIDGSWGRARLHVGLLGRFNAANLLAVLAVLLALDVPLDIALGRLARLRPVPGRMERYGGRDGTPLVVVDFAHTPAALTAALTALRAHCAGALWCVFGCGGDRDPGKRPLMGAAAAHLADRVIVTDDNPRTEDPNGIVADILAGVEPDAALTVIRDRESAIAEAIARAQADDVVLIAGKGHEEYQLVGDRRVAFSDRATVQRLVTGGGH
jgi:UDP-N-acetylmuramoyl-L-alanyl-D-glutamate--2,6-diaminopimelate ligase